MLGLGTCFYSWFSYPVALALNIVIVWFLVSLSIYFALFPVPSPFSFLSMCFVLFCFFSLFLSIIVLNSLQFVFPHSVLNIVGFSSIICSGILSFCRYSLFSIGQPSFYFLSRLVFMVFFSPCVIRSCMVSLFFFYYGYWVQVSCCYGGWLRCLYDSFEDVVEYSIYFFFFFFVCFMWFVGASISCSSSFDLLTMLPNALPIGMVSVGAASMSPTQLRMLAMRHQQEWIVMRLCQCRQPCGRCYQCVANWNGQCWGLRICQCCQCVVVINHNIW